jgi:hypothetical protein
MKTYPVLTEKGQETSAFEVDCIYIGLSSIVRLLVETENVTDVRTRRVFAESSDIHVEFKYFGQPYMVWEPFGDNSRYWIGPKESELTASHAATDLENAFKQYRPPFYRIILGEILTFQLITRALALLMNK